MLQLAPLPRRRGVRMSLKQAAKGGLGAALIIAVVAVALVVLLPGFATLLGRLVGGLWVTVMGAIAGLLGGFFGA
jgi:hypothetical protein